MSNRNHALKALLLTSVCAAALAASPASAVDTVVANGSSRTSVLTLSGTDTLTVNTGGTVLTNGSAVNWNGNATGAGVSVTNSGIMRDTAATNLPLVGSVSGVTGTMTITNSGLMETSNAANVSTVIYGGNTGSGATLVVNNTGTIRSAAGDVSAPFPTFPNTAISFTDGAGTTGSGNFTLNNSGAILGGIALGSGTNTLNFTTGSTVSGTIYFAQGATNNATLNLSGAGTGFLYGNFEGSPASTTFFGWTVFNTNVNSGNWTLIGMNDNRNTTVASGATLTVCATTDACATGRDMAHGTPTGASNIRMDGTDSMTVNAGGKLTTSGPTIITWGGNANGAGVTITNAGTIQGASIATGSPAGTTQPLINASAATPGTLYTAINSGTLTINNSGTMQSLGQVFNFNNVLAGASVVLNNSGTITNTGTTVTFNTIVNGVPTVVTQTALSSAFGAGTSAGTITITNSGSIRGNIGFGNGTGVLNLVTGSSILGSVTSPTAAPITVNLSGSGTGVVMGKTEVSGTNPPNFYGINNAGTMNVNSGNWTLVGGGYYNTLNVASGATFTICDIPGGATTCATVYSGANGTPTDGGIGALGTSLTVVDNGTIISQSDDPAVDYDPTSTVTGSMTGSGLFKFTGTGAGIDYINPNQTIAIANLQIANGTVIDGGAISSAVLIDSGATFQIGTGGTLKNRNNVTVDNGQVGTVTGNITDNGTLTFARLDSYTYSGTLSGTGLVSKIGAGTATVSGTNNFAGSINVQGGTLSTNGSSSFKLGGTSAVTIANGASLTGSGTALQWATNATGSGILITNNGTLRSTAAASTVLIGATSGVTGTMTIVNTGVIDSSLTANVAPLIYGGNLGSGATLVINNSGTIRSAAAVGVSAPTTPAAVIGFYDGVSSFGTGNFVLTNSGSIIGNIVLSGGTNTLNFTTGSTVSGIIAPPPGSGASTTTVNLSGSGTGFLYGAAEGNPATFLGWSSLAGDVRTNNVLSGSWRLIGGGDWRNTTISSGATLTICATTATCATGRDTAKGTPTQTGIHLDGIDTLTVNAGGTLTTSGPSLAVWSGNASGAGIVVTNAGTIQGVSIAAGSTTGNPLALFSASVATAGTPLQNITSGTLTINNSGTIQSLGGIFGFNNLTTAGVNVNITNSGTISNTQTTVTLNQTINGVPTIVTLQSLGAVLSGGLSAANYTITNSGTIHGGLNFGTGSNILNLVTGSALVGPVGVATGGTLTVNLSGSGTGFVMGKSEAVSGQPPSFYGITGAGTLNVNSGAWTLVGGGYYNTINIASGTTFTVCDTPSGASCAASYNGSNGTPNDGGLGPLGSSLSVVANGTLIVNSNDTGIDYDPTGTATSTLSGTGTYRAMGTGRNYISPTMNITVANVEILSGTTLIDSGTINSAVLINSGATLQIGTGGSVKNTSNVVLDNGMLGNVSGSIVDNGTLIFDRVDDFTMSANLSGSGSIIKRNSNKVTLTGVYTFTGATQLLGGSVQVGGTLSSSSTLQVGGGSSVNLGGTSQTVAGLSDAPASGGSGSGSGSGSTTPASTVDLGGGALTVNQTTSSSFSGNLTGSGTLTVNGTGTGTGTGSSSGSTLVLNGNSSSFTGTTNVTGGTLQIGSSSAPTANLGGTVNVTGGKLEVGDANAPGAQLTGSVAVGSGGTLGGHGTITGSVSNAGTTAPGGSIGTLHVVGNYTFANGSLLEQEVAANGATDLLQADGTVTIASGATAKVVNTDPVASYARVTNYTIITGAGGVSGTFTGVTTSSASFTPFLTYGSKAVNLALVRNDISLASVGATANQSSVGAAVNTGGGALYAAIAPNSDTVVRQSLDLASGEIHASLPSTILANDGMLASAMRNATHGDSLSFWANGGGAWTNFRASTNTAALSDTSYNAAAGADLPLGDGVRVGASAGYAHDTVAVAARASKGDIASVSVGGYAAYEGGPISLLGGVSYAWHSIDTLRGVNFAAISQSEVASYDGESFNLFSELRYRIALNGTAYVEPTASLRWSQLRTDGFTETGGSFALNGGSRTNAVGFYTLGTWLGRSFQSQSLGSITTRLFGGWEYTDGADGPLANLRLSNSQAFNVTGAAFGEDAVKAEAEIGFAMADGLSVGINYSGRYSARMNQQAVTARVGWHF